MRKVYNKPMAIVHNIVIKPVLSNMSNIPIDTTPGPSDAKRTNSSFSLFDDLLLEESDEDKE